MTTTWQEQAATCVIGDPDPSPRNQQSAFCKARHNEWCCTLPTEHTTQHVAGAYLEVCAVWPVTSCTTCGGSGRVADPGTASHPVTDDVACPTCDGA